MIKIDIVNVLSFINVIIHQRMESGQANPTIDTLSAIAQTFKVTMERLFKLNIIRTSRSPTDYLAEFIERYKNEDIGVLIREPEMALIWGNKVAARILTGKSSSILEPGTYKKLMKNSSLRILNLQRYYDQHGFVAPYLNYIGEEKNDPSGFIRCYPTNILPERGRFPIFTAEYVSPVNQDCEINYFKYCQGLLTLHQRD